MCISETSSTHNTPCSPSAGTPVGTHPMVDYVTEDGRYNGTSYTGVVSVFDDAVQEPASPMEWTCQEDSAYEEPEVSMPASQFADLLGKARAWDEAVREGQVHTHPQEGCGMCTDRPTDTFTQ